jgi:hypothetical protein
MTKDLIVPFFEWAITTNEIIDTLFLGTVTSNELIGTFFWKGGRIMSNKIIIFSLGCFNELTK